MRGFAEPCTNISLHKFRTVPQDLIFYQVDGSEIARWRVRVVVAL